MEAKPRLYDVNNSTTQLLEKRSLMYEITEDFERTKEEEREKEKEFKRREEVLRIQDFSIQQNLIKYNKHLQENEAKKSKAEKKYEEEYKQKKQKEDKIIDLNIEIQNLNERAARLEREVNRSNE